MEDEPRVASFVEKGLRAAGFTTTVCDDGLRAEDMATDEDFDLLVLDVGLPGQNGIALLRALRARGEKLPIVMLTARDGVAEIVAGLEGGADDYISKPFEFEELLARIRARLRSRVGAEPQTLRAGGVELDLISRRAHTDQGEVTLTAREFKLLESFLRHAGEVLTREQLLAEVWGYDADPGSNIVDVYIGYLRRKLGPNVIATARGMGYRVDASPGPQNGPAQT